MRKLIPMLSVVLVLALASPGGAIVNGELDGDDHPNVGALIGDFDGDKIIICSGTLIAPDVFLTASHCTAFLESIGQSTAWVSFDGELEEPVESPPATLHQGTLHTHPDFGFSGPGGASEPHDIAVVVLDQPVQGIQPASLPTLNQLGQAAAKNGLKRQKFTAVGYGVHEAVLGGGPPSFPFDGDRWRAVSEYRSLENAWLHLSQNRSTGDGGTCFGDSGGPNFLGAGAGETDVVAGITVMGDSMCRATNVTYRLDTASARDFLDGFVSLP
ncbi:MAG TPA: trypsin-like serine protease [Actinomycetota bacterium]